MLQCSYSPMSHPALALVYRDKVTASFFPMSSFSSLSLSPPFHSLHQSRTAGTASGIAGSKCAGTFLLLLPGPLAWVEECLPTSSSSSSSS